MLSESFWTEQVFDGILLINGTCRDFMSSFDGSLKKVASIDIMIDLYQEKTRNNCILF
jgi:hypothetical protein